MRILKAALAFVVMAFGPVVGGCGAVEPTDVGSIEQAAVVAKPTCTGSITCCSSTSCTNVLCKPSFSECKARCPSGTTYTSGTCKWVEPAPTATAPELAE
jgi:hypothetical protein